MTIYEVVKKLIGSIKPYGETNIDKKRLDNLEYHKQLTESLILDLVDSAQFRKRKEYSMKKNWRQGLSRVKYFKKYN